MPWSVTRNYRLKPVGHTEKRSEREQVVAAKEAEYSDSARNACTQTGQCAASKIESRSYDYTHRRFRSSASKRFDPRDVFGDVHAD